MTGITYVMTHRGYRSVKVGYTSPDSLRLSGLRRGGWEPFRQLACESTSLAREIEQAALFEIRFRLYVPVHLTPTQMRGVHGWSETSSIAVISPSEVWEIVCEKGALEQLAPTVKKTRVYKPPVKRGVRRSGDVPDFVRAARIEASRTARANRVGGPQKSKAKNARQKDQ
jgi:hypothetical protein